MESSLTEIKRTVNSWWIFLIVGELLIIAGIWLLVRPDFDFAELRMLFIFLFTIGGAAEIYFAFSNRRVLPSWLGILLFAAFEITLALMLSISPFTSANGFSIYFGLWLLSRAILFFLAALDLSLLGFTPDWMWFVGAGMFTVVMGGGIFLQPMILFGTIVIWTAMAMSSVGAFLIFFAYKLLKIAPKTAEIERKVAVYKAEKDYEIGQDTANHL